MLGQILMEQIFLRSGRSVSLSSDGSRVAIGAPYNDGNGSNSGHVRIYELQSGVILGLKLGSIFTAEVQVIR